MGPIFEKTFDVPFYMVDEQEKMTIGSAMNLVIEASGMQLNAQHAGVPDLMEAGLGWVVVQYHLDIVRYPKFGEKIIVGTQATQYNRFFCYRDYWINDADGNRIITVKSIWLMLDLQKRSLTPVNEELVSRTGAEMTKGAVKLPKVKKIDSSKVESEQNIDVSYFDIDSNKHVNNVRYFDWAQNALGFDFLHEHEARSIDIKFDHEIIFGDTPKIIVEKIEQEENILTNIQVDNAGVVAAELTIEWNKGRA